MVQNMKILKIEFRVILLLLAIMLWVTRVFQESKSCVFIPSTNDNNVDPFN